MKLKELSISLLLFYLPLWAFCQEVSKKSTSASESNTITDNRDGEVYKTAKIGNQVWMAENLRYNAKGSYLNPNNPNKKYGRLYNWVTIMDLKKKYLKNKWEGSTKNHQGICPNGWHVPTDEEWTALEVALGLDPTKANGSGHRGKHGDAMRSTNGWTNKLKGNNSSGFNVLPAGEYSFREFKYLGNSASFWTSSFDPNYSYLKDKILYRKFYGSAVSKNTLSKEYAISCRCVKN